MCKSRLVRTYRMFILISSFLKVLCTDEWFHRSERKRSNTINANSVIDIEEGAIKGISNKAVIKVPKKHYKKYQKKLTGSTGYKKKTMKLKKK